MPTIYQSQDPLKDAIAKVAADNIDRITVLKIAKDFTNIGDAFVGFEGKDKNGQYFQLHVDYDPDKKEHVKMTINGNERHEYMGQTYTWFEQVIKNINGGSYCNVSQNSKDMWETEGQEKNLQYIDGMKKYMRQYL